MPRIRGNFLDYSVEELNSFGGDWDVENYTDLDRSYGFRCDLIEEGYKILHMYRCYYQGWECDEWGAIGIDAKGDKYLLETNHGFLYPKKLPPNWKPEFKSIVTFHFADEDEE